MPVSCVFSIGIAIIAYKNYFRLRLSSITITAAPAVARLSPTFFNQVYNISVLLFFAFCPPAAGICKMNFATTTSNTSANLGRCFLDNNIFMVEFFNYQQQFFHFAQLLLHPCSAASDVVSQQSQQIGGLSALETSRLKT